MKDTKHSQKLIEIGKYLSKISTVDNIGDAKYHITEEK